MTRPRCAVVAFGGNACYPPTIKGLASEQLALMHDTTEHLVKAVEGGLQLVVTHGNGPVVGNILFRMARTARGTSPWPVTTITGNSTLRFSNSS